MKIATFSAQNYEKSYFTAAAQQHQHEITFFEVQLNNDTVKLAADFNVVCCFVNDHLDATVLETLHNYGIKLIALRCAGFNNVDLQAAKKFNITVVRVPEYSPYAVAEFAVTLILALNRKIIRARAHTREHNFLLNGLLGFDLHGKTVGIIGTGKIGRIFAKIMHGFGCKLVAYDIATNQDCQQLGVDYVNLDNLCQQSDILSLHCPLNKKTRHIINEKSINEMKDGIMLINTGRGGLIDSKAIVQALKQRKIGYLGMDVYEEEENLFFQDHTQDIIQDDVFARLETFPNVIITGHQAFFTK